MEVTITQFRKQLFTLVEEALQGNEVWVKHKGRRVKLIPEKPISKLDRLTPVDFINFDTPQNGSMLAEMTRAWEKDWEELDRLS